MPKEIWKRVLGYEIWYEVSNKANVRSYHKRGSKIAVVSVAKWMMPQYSKKFAYLCVPLSRGIGKARLLPIHILVARAFVKNPNPKKYKYVNHKNGDKLDNRPRNLEWCTLGENQKHAYESGLRKKPNGKLNGRCILSEKQVIEIFKSKENQYMLAATYGVSRAAVANIQNGKTWSSLTNAVYSPNPKKEISEKDVLFIYHSLMDQKALSKKFKVSQPTISAIKTGRSYSNITGQKFIGKKEYNYYGLTSTVGRRA